jgi:hypothetical protein
MRLEGLRVDGMYGKKISAFFLDKGIGENHSSILCKWFAKND